MVEVPIIAFSIVIGAIVLVSVASFYLIYRVQVQAFRERQDLTAVFMSDSLGDLEAHRRIAPEHGGVGEGAEPVTVRGALRRSFVLDGAERAKARQREREQAAESERIHG